MSQITESQNSIKTARAKTVRVGRRATTWPDVLRVIQHDETRAFALSQFRRSGFSADEFGHSQKARERMADALSRTEDWLELKGARKDAERAAIREVRRQLEAEMA